MPVRLSLGLLLAIAGFVVSCDPGGPSEIGSDPSGSSQTLSEASGKNGQVGVEIRVNHNPVITAMNATWMGPNRQELVAEVSDRDGDPLSFAWSHDCAGTLDNPQAAQPIVTYDLPLPASCTIHLDVNDGQGGTHAGDLTLSLASVAVVEGE